MELLQVSIGPYFIETAYDVNNSGTFTVLGTQQLMSVPYALYAASSGTPGPQGIQGPQGATGATGPQGIAGTNGVSITNSYVQNDSLYVVLSNGQKIKTGYVKGPQGLTGATGVQGIQGPAGTNGTNGVNITNSYIQNDSLYVTLSNGQKIQTGYVKGAKGDGIPSGGTQGQVITMCDGVAVWTTGGQCPGKIASLDCGNVILNGNVYSGVPVSASCIVPYTGGNGGTYTSKSLSSSGVTGLTATLAQGTFASGSGNISFSLSGTPSSSGQANFTLNIGGKNCTMTIAVNASPYSSGTVHCTATPTAIVDVTNPATGKTLMDRNLGASQVATSSTDANAYGDLYQWGRGADGHQCRNSTTTGTLSSSDQPGHGSFILASNSSYDWRSSQNDNLWQGVNGVNNPCPSGYRLPTFAELDAERASWSIKNSVGAFSSPLKLLLAGFRNVSDGSLVVEGIQGRYWSSTVDYTQSLYLLFYISNTYNYTSTYNRGSAFSVRCIKD